MTSAFDGAVYRPHDSGYETARCGAVWNGLKPHRFPAVIVVADSQRDVVRAVNLARREGLSVGVRSGGHSWVGNAVRDGGLLLDLSRLKSIQIDTESRTATIEPGVHGSELVAALSDYDHYFPSGHCPSVAVTGFILGGGWGMNSNIIGPAAYSLRAIDVVTADGHTLHATDDDHADVLWAARGAGPGFFAVVTRLYLELRPKPGVIASTIQLHPMSAYDELVPWFARTTAEMGNANLPLPMITAGVSPLLPDSTSPVLNMSAYCFADDLEHAQELLAPLQSAPGMDNLLLHGPVHAASVQEIYDGIDLHYPEGLRYISDSLWLQDPIGDDFIADAKAVIEALPTTRSTAWLIPWTPRTHPNAALSLQSRMSFQVYTIYADGADDAAMRSAQNAAIGRIDKHSLGGGMVNDSDLFEHPMAVLTPANSERLERLRRTYDPDGRFYGYPTELPPARI